MTALALELPPASVVGRQSAYRCCRAHCYQPVTVEEDGLYYCSRHALAKLKCGDGIPHRYAGDSAETSRAETVMATYA